MRTKPSMSLLSSDQRAAAFWITNTFNTIRHNHAAGGAQVGYWVSSPPESGHANADCPPIVRSHCPMFTQVQKWYNNTAHDMGFYGFWIFSLKKSLHYNPSTIDCEPSWPPGHGTFENGKFWHCRRGAEISNAGDNVKLKNFVAASNRFGGLSILEGDSWRYGGEFGEYSMGFEDATVIGYIDPDVPELAQCTHFGIETPWEPHAAATFHGVHFFNFDGDWPWQNDFCTAIDACYNSYPFDCGRTTQWSRVKYTNAPRKHASDWEHETALVDLDGTLTGMNVPGYTVVPKSSLYPQSMCVDAPEFSVQFPCQICNSIEFVRFGLNKVQPNSLEGAPLMVTNKWGVSNVPFRFKRSTHANGWMGLLLNGEDHALEFAFYEHITNVSYRAAGYDIGQDKYFTITHPFHQSTDYANIAGNKEVLDTMHTTITGMEFIFHYTLVDDFKETFFGQKKIDGRFSPADTPLDYYINPNNNRLTYGLSRDVSPNRYYDIHYNFKVYKCFWPGCTPPTTPPPTTPPVITNKCDWSNPACWANNTIPADGENVTIPIDKEVTIDIDIVVDILFVEGTVQVADTQDITITARNILINTGAGFAPEEWTHRSVMMQNGNFFAGSKTQPWSCSNTLTINLLGNRFQPEFGAPAGAVPIGAKTIGVMGGLKLYGCPRGINWALLQRDINQGDTMMKLNKNVGGLWKAGDQLSIAPTSYDSREAEMVTITNVINGTVWFTPPVNFTHYGAADSQDHYGHMGAEISLLTRNIKINGIDNSDDIFGGRVVVLRADNGFTYRAGWAQIDNVEFLYMGQFGHTQYDDLRYPVAFYFLGWQDDTDPEHSFISGCSIHHSFNGGIAVGRGTNNLKVTDNIMYHIISDAIEVHANDAVLTGNVITQVIWDKLHQDLYLSSILGNSQMSERWIPCGINTRATKLITMKNNRVAGGDGPAYKGHGLPCKTSDLCNSVTMANYPIADNIGHSTLHGYIIFKEVGRPCAEFSGFYFWRIMDYGFYTMIEGSNILITNNIIVDTVVGVMPVMVGNGWLLKHQHGNMMASIDNNVFVGRSIRHSCEDYQKRENALIRSSGLTSLSEALWNERLGHTAIYMPYFIEKFAKFPKQPMYDLKESSYNSPNGRSCLSGNAFMHFNDDFMCSSRRPIVITDVPTAVDHTHMVEIQKSLFYNSTVFNKIYFHRPLLKHVTLDDCVDMACDAPRRTFIKDLDATFVSAAAGPEVSIFAQSEYHWDGVEGRVVKLAKLQNFDIFK